MRVFIALRVPRSNLERADLVLAAQQTDGLAQVIRQAGHEPWVAYREIEQRGLQPSQFMPFVRAALGQSGLLLVLYEPDLRGGLIEMGIAYAMRVPIWLAYPIGIPVSNSAMGCANRLLPYTALSELLHQVAAGLAALQAR
jgi:hypothetical protein